MPEPQIWAYEPTGPQSLQPMCPDCWAGEVDCVIGPFSSREAAHIFVSLKVDFSALGSVLEHIFAKGDAWYVELKVLIL